MAYTYAYAKILSQIPHTYINEKLNQLLNVRRLQEIYDILFPGERTEVLERRLAPELQRKIHLRCIKAIIKILNLIEKPHPILVHALRKYEYQNVKSIIRFLKDEKTAPTPLLWDLSPYALLPITRADFANSENIENYLKESPYDWALKKSAQNEPFYLIDNLLDIHYYKTLWGLMSSLGKEERQGAYKLVSLEVLLQNIIWAMRLRFFFKIRKEKAQELLIDVSKPMLEPALQVFDFAADEPSEWLSWKYSWLVRDQINKETKRLDPVGVEEKARQYFNKRVWNLLHQAPFSLTPFLCYIKLKELEASLLQSVVEGYNMNLPQEEILGVISNK
jgi:vacuolar-type H+-ATPase subunit C/Vma6